MKDSTKILLQTVVDAKDFRRAGMSDREILSNCFYLNERRTNFEAARHMAVALETMLKGPEEEWPVIFMKECMRIAMELKNNKEAK